MRNYAGRPTWRDLTCPRGHEPKPATRDPAAKVNTCGAAACGDGNDHRSSLPSPGKSRCYPVTAWNPQRWNRDSQRGVPTERRKDMIKRQTIGRLAIALMMSGALSMGAAALALGREG